MTDTTSLAESSQAFFCAIADYLTIKGKNLNEFLDPKDKSKGLDTFTGFESKWKSVFKNNSDSLHKIYEKFTEASTGSRIIPYGEIEGFLMFDKGWYTSSCLIGKKLVEDISTISKGFNKKPSTSDVWYFRGDKDVMKNLEDLFKVANKNKADPKFGDVNKWSPADIYFATNKARERIKANVADYVKGKGKAYGFDIMNNMVNELIESGDLLPISLKKQTNSVTIKKVNFDRAHETSEILKYGFYGFKKEWKKYELDNPQTRDLQIKFSTSDRESIKIRHDASTAAMKTELESKDMEARGGSIGSWKIFCDILELIDPKIASEELRLYNAANEKYKKEAKKLKMEYQEKVKRLTNPAAIKMARDQFDKDRGALDAMMVTNVIFPPLIKWLKANSRDNSNNPDYIPPADRFMQEIYKYATSRTEDSSRFIISK